MSAVGKLDRIFNYKFIFYGALAAFALNFATLGYAEPTASDVPLAFEGMVDAPTIEELRAHAATITEILETASERVELLAAADADAPALVDAIKQELSLSRRWNRHLGTILLDVAEARRALGEREREAAKEIARMTAMAEEARLELLALKNVLTQDPDEAAQSREGWPEGRLDGKPPVNIGRQLAHTGRQLASSRPIAETMIEDIAGPEADLEDARTALASMREAQKSASSDVDAVRAKIIEALETLADMRGDLPTGEPAAGADLSSKDLTGWAASMATRLNRPSRTEAE
ncbi:MAG: hypothetical protein OEU92_29980 [Alphaproteobacteria bacterium]|nr:hypothetical protein [Alphaproteobacteria bacterium]